MAARSSSLFYKVAGYFVGSIKFDLLLNESHSLESTVTEHQVENGATVSDHIHQMPRKGSLIGLVTNHPIVNHPVLPDEFLKKLNAIGKSNFAQDIVNTYGAAFGYRQDGGPTKEDFANLERPEGRAKTTWSRFKVFMDKKIPVTIVTGLDTYTDVVVTKVGTDRDGKTGDCLQFRVEFQEIKFVALTDVALTTTTGPVDLKKEERKQAMPKAKKGKTGGKDTQSGAGQPSPLESAAFDGGAKTENPNVKSVQGTQVLKKSDGSLVAIDATTKKPVPWHVGNPAKYLQTPK